MARVHWLILLITLSSSATAHAQDLTFNAQLLVAARNSDEAGVKRLLEVGAAPNSRNRKGDTSLIIAAKKGNFGIAKLLLEHGADVNMQNVEKVTALMSAAYYGHADIVKALLEHKARVDIRTGCTKPRWCTLQDRAIPILSYY